MKKTDFAKCAKMLQSSYSRDFTEEDLIIWYMQFKDEDANTMFKAINNLIRTSKYMPSISEILQEIKKIENPALSLNYDEEFSKVRQAIRRYGGYREQELLESLEPRTRETVKRIGLKRICECEQDRLKFIKNEFQEIFENIQEDDIKNSLNGGFSLVSELANRMRLENKENQDEY